MIDRYGGLVDQPGEARGDGESWADAADRLRGDRDRLHPLVSEVSDDAN